MEVVITVAIVATLASVALPLSELAIQRNKETELRRALRDIRDAIDSYKRAADEGRIVRAADDSGYPTTLDVLVQGVQDVKSASGKTLYFLRRIPRDPMQPAGDWGLRSYESTPTDPKPGKDVYDIYSLSERKGLNGIVYREW